MTLGMASGEAPATHAFAGALPLPGKLRQYSRTTQERTAMPANRTIGWFSTDVEVEITDDDVHDWAKRHPDEVVKVIGQKPIRTDTLYRELNDWHNREHRLAFRVCDHPVCHEAHREAWAS